MRKFFGTMAVLLSIGAGCAGGDQDPTKSAPRHDDHRNIAYLIEGREVLLRDGVAENVTVPGAASKSIVRHFGNEVRADFDGDAREDVAFLLTADEGGSGTFFYLAVARGSENGYVGTNAVFIGDRIAPQTTEFREGWIVVNYAERNDGSGRPSKGATKRFQVRDGALQEAY